MQLRRASTLVLVLMLLAVMSCRQESPGQNPLRSRMAETTAGALVDELATVSLAELAGSPASYLGQTVQVTGRFQRLAALACSRVRRPLPASWRLVDGESGILVNGHHDQLARLAPSGLTITIAGRWWSWEGSVGCGKNAPRQTVYYLDLAQVLTPNPITVATLTPSAPLAELQPTLPLPEGTSGAATVSPTATVTPPAPAASPTATTSGTALTATPTPTLMLSQTPTSTPGGTPTPDGTGTAITPTPSLTPSPTDTLEPGATVEATATQDEKATPTITVPATLPSGATQTPTPTATTSGTPILKGDLSTQDLVIELIAAGETHRWDFQVDASTVLTVSVASPVATNMTVTIRDSSGATLLTQDEATAGEPEVASVTLPAGGTYAILLAVEDGTASTYSLLLADTDSYAFIFKGTLSYGDSAQALMAGESDHFWHYWGEQGDSIALLSAPNDQSDLFMELYGPDATLLLDDPIDEGGAGVPEALLNFELPETGFYAVRVGEFSFQVADYTISLDDFSTGR